MKINRQKLILKAHRSGADIAGVARVNDLIKASAILHEPLKGACSAVVVGARQSVAALNSAVIQVAQHDTAHAYGRADSAAHAVVRALEDAGHQAVAIPGFLPIDMSDEVKGMTGEVDHRRAAVLAGIGVYGRNNLLLTERFGPRVRLATVLTTAKIEPGKPIRRSLCTDCGACVEACPSHALEEKGKTDKTACGKTVFQYGLRGLMRFGYQWNVSTEDDRAELLKGRSLRELWQNFMVGMYYTCFACQAVCPVGVSSASRRTR